MAAKLRSVNTHFWDDDYIAELPPLEKLLFLYLLTCPSTNIAGIYELTRRLMLFHTGLTYEQIDAALARFKTDGKVIYVDNYIIMVNHLKNQNLNINMLRSRTEIINTLPVNVRKAFESLPKTSEAFESLPQPFVQYKEEYKEELKEELKEEEKGKNRAARAKVFWDDVLQKQYLEQYSEAMLRAFCTYWCEPTRNGKKLRFELERTWDTAGRLATWQRRDDQFAGKPQANEARYYSYGDYLTQVNADPAKARELLPVKLADGKLVWVHVDDIKKFNLKIFKKENDKSK